LQRDKGRKVKTKDAPNGYARKTPDQKDGPRFKEAPWRLMGKRHAWVKEEGHDKPRVTGHKGEERHLG